MSLLLTTAAGIAMFYTACKGIECAGRGIEAGGKGIYYASQGIQNISGTLGNGLRFINQKPNEMAPNLSLENNGGNNAYPGLTPKQIEGYIKQFGDQQKELELIRLQGMSELQQRTFLHQCRLQRNEIVARRHLQAQQQRFLATESEKTRAFDSQENAMDRLFQLKLQQNEHNHTSSENNIDRDLQATMYYIDQINKRWPLYIDPMEFIDQNLYFAKFYKDGVPKLADISHETVTPLKVIVIPFDVPSVSVNNQATIKLTGSTGSMIKHMASNYDLDNSDNPVELLDGAWNSSFVHGGAAIHNIFNVMRRTPTLILEQRVCGSFIEFNYGYWNGLSANYEYQNVIRIDFPKLVALLVRQQTEQLKDALNPDVTNILSQDELCMIQKNLGVYSVESNTQTADVVKSLLSRNYAITPDIEQKLQEIIGFVQTFYTSFLADLHHLYYNIACPVLPQYIAAFYEKLSVFEKLNGCGFPSMQELCAMYACVFENLLEENRSEDSVIIKLYYAKTMAYFGERQGALKILSVACADICDALELGHPIVDDDEIQSREGIKKLLSCDSLKNFEDAYIPLKECKALLIQE